jgi:hypothetical protein
LQSNIKMMKKTHCDGISKEDMRVVVTNLMGASRANPEEVRRRCHGSKRYFTLCRVCTSIG